MNLLCMLTSINSTRNNLELSKGIYYTLIGSKRHKQMTYTNVKKESMNTKWVHGWRRRKDMAVSRKKKINGSQEIWNDLCSTQMQSAVGVYAPSQTIPMWFTNFEGSLYGFFQFIVMTINVCAWPLLIIYYANLYSGFWSINTFPLWYG